MKKTELELLREIEEEAHVIMRLLEIEGPKIVPYLIAIDDNPGWRLRKAYQKLKKLRIKEATEKVVSGTMVVPLQKITEFGPMSIQTATILGIEIKTIDANSTLDILSDHQKKLNELVDTVNKLCEHTWKPIEESDR